MIYRYEVDTPLLMAMLSISYLVAACAQHAHVFDPLLPALPVPDPAGVVTTRPVSLLWMIALVGMLLVPSVLIVVVNLALMRIVVTAYM